MYTFVTICILLMAAGTNAGFSSSSQSAQANTGYNPNPDILYAPYNAHLAAIQEQTASGYTTTYASPNAIAYANALLVSDPYLQQQQMEFHQQLQEQAANLAASIQQQAYGAQQAAFSNSGSGGPNYAGASVSVGPDGIYQSGFVYPPNPDSPNFETRIDLDPQGGSESQGGNPQGYGIASSSFSASTNVNGVEQKKGGSVTTVNDNGKIYTYETHS